MEVLGLPVLVFVLIRGVDFLNYVHSVQFVTAKGLKAVVNDRFQFLISNKCVYV